MTLDDQRPPAHESRQSWVRRPILTHLLENAREARVILLSAPAGAGKSTLVAQWRATAGQDRPFAWIALDRTLNEPSALWRAVLHATTPGAAKEPRRRTLRGRAGPTLFHVLNVLAAREDRAVLVLDDLHVIDAPDCLRQLEALIDHLPATAQLVLITRAEPALPLAKYRAAGELLELRMADLALSCEDAATLVRQVSGVLLQDHDLDRVLAATEGWAIAVHLAAMSLRTAPDPAAFTDRFTGTHRAVTDFLEEEVLHRIAPDVRRFLRRVSVLERLTAPLCDEVAGTANAAELLQSLDGANMFLVPLDDNRRWYRLHRLFRQAMADELTRGEPDLVPMLHRRAGDWYGRNGMLGEATEHMLAGGDSEGPTSLLQAHWMEFVSTGRLAALQELMGTIGTAAIGRDAVTAISAAWAAALSGDPGATRHWLSLAESLPHEGALPDGSPSIAFSAALIRGLFGFDGVPDMLTSAMTAADMERDPTSRWHAPARLALAHSLYLTGDPGSAVQYAQAAAQNLVTSPTTRILALSVMSLALTELGRDSEAAEPSRMAAELVQSNGLAGSARVTLAAHAAGVVLTRQGGLQEGIRLLESALDLRRSAAGLSPWPTLALLSTLAETCLGAGDHAGARDFLGHARRLLAAEGDGGEHLRGKLARLHTQLIGVLTAQPRPEILPLTAREHTVLTLLQKEASLREIGLQLFVSTNTIKTHTRSIYRKLGATSRHEAISIARQMRLL
ncbi:LuxR C-terminal-related transcriptional regulator [Nonomuraea rosea]|uniref:LuxR C-terminal-related transcriptional regulator n=1 Tax=Nonomuraea rosea TaxID=638574 RepID=A0ABP6ZL72_9ACTN